MEVAAAGGEDPPETEVAAAGGEDPPETEVAAAGGEATPAWAVWSDLTLVAGAATSFDLSAELPQSVRRGGRFSVDRSGLPLPPGVRLTPEGVLTVDAAALAGLTPGVVFAYAEP
jgi:hypothetical protein